MFVLKVSFYHPYPKNFNQIMNTLLIICLGIHYNMIKNECNKQYF
ncbi:DUF1145 domain-containing protein [Bacillus capparidis]